MGPWPLRHGLQHRLVAQFSMNGKGPTYELPSRLMYGGKEYQFVVIFKGHLQVSEREISFYDRLFYQVFLVSN